METSQQYHFSDFTEQTYRSILQAAKKHYSFEPFGTDYKQPHVLWRHDVDISPHRALRLAEIEAEEGVQATYFILLRGEFYNPFERVITDIIRKISALGHEIGLHFDPSYYYIPEGQVGPLEKYIAYERTILEDLIDVKLTAVSFHNPDVGNVLQFDQNELAGLHNTYGQTFRDGYMYVSDSNGIWRHKRLPDVVSRCDSDYLQVLTHPVWWTSGEMSPRDKVDRALNGRMKQMAHTYDELLSVLGRDNIR